MSFINVNGILVEDRIFTAKFACDYDICKGCCCHKPLPGVSLNGGALSDYDAAEILLKRKELAELCDEDVKEVAADKPVMKYNGDFYTTICNDKCVFSSMKLGGCALKTSGKQGITDIGIPLSCQLYPILWEVTDTEERLVIGDVFGDWCDCGYAKGERENIYLLDFFKEAIIRGLGNDFYLQLKEIQKKLV